jgi:hypothetical protein
MGGDGWIAIRSLQRPKTREVPGAVVAEVAVAPGARC